MYLNEHLLRYTKNTNVRFQTNGVVGNSKHRTRINEF